MIIKLTIFKALSILEPVQHVVVGGILAVRYKRSRQHDSFRENKMLRIMWYLLLCYQITTSIGVFLWIPFTYCKGPIANRVVAGFRSGFGHMWSYFSFAIEIALYILVKKTVLRAQKRSTTIVKKLNYLFIVPPLNFLLNIPLIVVSFSDPRDEKGIYRFKDKVEQIHRLSVLLNGIIYALFSIWLKMEFRKLISIVNENETTRIKNVKRIKGWNLFTDLNVIFGISTAIFYICNTADNHFELGILGLSKNLEPSTDQRKYPIARMWISILKFMIAIIFVIYSPYTSIKIKKDRKQKIHERGNNSNKN